MPGANAHLSVVNDAQARAEQAGLREETLASLGLNLKFVELGALGPDYPYLAMKPGQAKWADAMHYTNTAALLRAGVGAVARLEGLAKEKALAWFMGFAAHVATDMTIHPVVELKVGPYKGNEGEHRRCELHQDAFIFPRIMNVGDTGLSEHLATGVATCHAPGDEDEIDPIVGEVWQAMLLAAYPKLAAQSPPVPGSWHRGFRDILATMAGANHLFPFARHVGARLNLAYPAEADIDPAFISQIQTPEGPMDYPEVYERARSNVLAVWKGLEDALAGEGRDALQQLEDWNLDTGRSLKTNRRVFWKEPL